MDVRLIAKDFLTYGVTALAGKVMVAFLLIAAPADADDLTVLALGDSLTQGFGLPEEDGFVPQLETWLRGQGADVRVINGGVSGDTTAGGAARVAWSLTPDVDAMIVALGANDMLRGIDPNVSRENLAKILQVGRDRDVPMLLIGQKAPANFGPEYKDAFDAMFPDLAEAFDVPLAPDFFAGLEGVEIARWPEFFQPDGLHPNATGVSRIVDALGPIVIKTLPRE